MIPSPLLPSQDAGRSLAEIAQRDLDAALQLLTDRAQYITGASGAAIALRRAGMNDMLCRASTGDNAPELGALLSTEYGLSGESVRTRQALRCDDAEQDARVNREVCRQLGIASVVVMPVVHDDEVLGVFELFSGRANAFGERDLSAVQRLTEMVQTAVRLATAAETLAAKLNSTTGSEADAMAAASESFSAEIVDGPVFPDDFLPEVEIMEVEAPEPAAAQVAATETVPGIIPAVQSPEPAQPGIAAVSSVAIAAATATASPAPAVSPEFVPARKKLFWSAELVLSAEAKKTAAADQSHVPPVLRGLRKCEACGFPVSAARVLCVECEEKKWRGQLKRP